MGRRYVLLDDLDGSELPEDTSPVSLSLGRSTYNVYLSEQNYGKLIEALNPFIENAEKADTKPQSSGTKAKPASDDAEKERLKKARAWAIETGQTFKDAQGNDKAVGVKGRLNSTVFDAWVAAGEPEVGEQ